MRRGEHPGTAHNLLIFVYGTGASAAPDETPTLILSPLYDHMIPNSSSSSSSFPFSSLY